MTVEETELTELLENSKIHWFATVGNQKSEIRILFYTIGNVCMFDNRRLPDRQNVPIYVLK